MRGPRGWRRVNEQLWEIEDDIRLCEGADDFGPRFIELVCGVYRANDRRSEHQAAGQHRLGCPMGDEKAVPGILLKPAFPA